MLYGPLLLFELILFIYSQSHFLVWGLEKNEFLLFKKYLLNCIIAFGFLDARFEIILTRNAKRWNIHDDLLHLSLNFQRPLWNGVEHL